MIHSIKPNPTAVAPYTSIKEPNIELSTSTEPSIALDQTTPDIATKLIESLKETEKTIKAQGAILIAVGEDILYYRYGGALSKTEEKSIGPSTRFAIGSVSKQFTAAALLQQMHRLWGLNIESRLNKPISSYLEPSHPIWGDEFPEWADRVTLHQLLTHSSGLKDFTNDKLFKDPEFHKAFHTSKEYLNLVKTQELAFEPGTDRLYSNTGYLLLAEVLHALSGSELSSCVEKMCKKAKMTNTWAPLEGTTEELRIADPALASIMDSNGIPTEDNFSCASGCGSLISNAEDLLRWNLALHKHKTILPEKIYQLMCSNHIQEEGYGIGVEPTSRGILLGHQGFLNGFDSLLLYEPASELSVIILSNDHTNHNKILEVVLQNLALGEDDIGANNALHEV